MGKTPEIPPRTVPRIMPDPATMGYPPPSKLLRKRIFVLFSILCIGVLLTALWVTAFLITRDIPEWLRFAIGMTGLFVFCVSGVGALLLAVEASDARREW